LLVGPKRSGKGTIGRVLTGLLGRHSVAAPTLAGMATNFGLSPLIDRPLALISDARLSGRTDSSLVVERLLSITGQDALTIDRKYREPWTGRLPARFVILTNELPRLSDSSGALASRFVALVLTRSFYGHENPLLTGELLTEAPAIFNWALDGLDRLLARGYFVVPASARESIEALHDLSSPVAAFIRERCHVAPGATVLVDDLFGHWQKWCTEQGNEHCGTASSFAVELRSAVPTLRKVRLREDNRRARYLGLGLGGDPPIFEGASRDSATNLHCLSTADSHGQRATETDKTRLSTPVHRGHAM
jgi:putative DNA primase/helicase